MQTVVVSVNGIKVRLNTKDSKTTVGVINKSTVKSINVSQMPLKVA